MPAAAERIPPLPLQVRITVGNDDHVDGLHQLFWNETCQSSSVSVGVRSKTYNNPTDITMYVHQIQINIYSSIAIIIIAKIRYLKFVPFSSQPDDWRNAGKLSQRPTLLNSRELQCIKIH